MPQRVKDPSQHPPTLTHTAPLSPPRLLTALILLNLNLVPEAQPLPQRRCARCRVRRARLLLLALLLPSPLLLLPFLVVLLQRRRCRSR